MRTKAVDQFDLDGNFIQTWHSIAQAASALGLLHGNLIRALDISSRSEGGFKWKTAVEQRGEALVYRLKHTYTEEDRKAFEDRLKTHLPVLYNLLKPYDFINAWNKDDYMQEALAYAWMQFYTYKGCPGDGQRFGAWFKITCRWGLFRYYHYLKKWRTSEFDDLDFDGEVEEDVDVAKTIALYESIDKLKEPDRRIIKAWLDEKDTDEILKAFNLNKNKYYKKIMRIKNLLRELFNQHYYGIVSNQIQLMENPRHDAVPVEQYDLMGRFVASYPTIESVKEKGFSINGVSGCLSLRNRTSGGFMWKRAKIV